MRTVHLQPVIDTAVVVKVVCFTLLPCASVDEAGNARERELVARGGTLSVVVVIFYRGK